MSKRKYKEGKKILSMAEFEQSKCQFFVLAPHCNKWTRHRTVLENLTYKTLRKFILDGCIYEAEKIEEREL